MKNNNKKIYLCGDMLHKAQFDHRKNQKQELEQIKNIEVYNPSSNDDINNKKEAISYKLAERIVEQDTTAIENSDVYVIDVPTADAGGRGTITEIGQIYQMKRESEKAIMRLEYHKNLACELGEMDSVQSIDQEIQYHQSILDKKVLAFSDDVRWNTTDMNDDMDRVPYSFNAYVYGVILYLTNGTGIISWEQVKQELDELANGKTESRDKNYKDFEGSEFKNTVIHEEEYRQLTNKEKRKYFNKKNKKKPLKNKLKRGK